MIIKWHANVPFEMGLIVFVVFFAAATVLLCVGSSGRFSKTCSNKSHLDWCGTTSVERWAHPKPRKEILTYFMTHEMARDKKKKKAQNLNYCQHCVDRVEQIIQQHAKADVPQQQTGIDTPGPSTHKADDTQAKLQNVGRQTAASREHAKIDIGTSGTSTYTGSVMVQSCHLHWTTLTHQVKSWCYGNPTHCAAGETHQPKSPPPPPPPPPSQLPPPPPGWSKTIKQDFILYYNFEVFEYRDPIITKTLTLNTDGTFHIRLFGREVDPTDSYFQQFQAPLTHAGIINMLQLLQSTSLCIGYPDPKYQALIDSWDQTKREKFLFHDNVVFENQIMQSTLRGQQCRGFVSGTGTKCKRCTAFGNSLRPAFLRHNLIKKKCLRSEISSHVPIGHLSKSEAQNRAKKLTKVRKALNQKVRRLQKKLDALIEKEGERLEPSMSKALLATMECHSKQVSETFPKDSFGYLFWQQQIKAAMTKDPRGHRWHPMIIKWALNLRLASGKAYRVLRGSKFIQLPHEATLKEYLHWTTPDSGFSLQALEQLYREMDIGNRESYQKLVVIVHDEMKIKSDLVYNKHTGELVGFMDLGDVQNNLRHYEAVVNKTLAPEDTMAKHMFVIMVRGLFWNVTYPLAHFPTLNTKSDEIFALCWRAIQLLELADLKVVCITCDGAATNRRFFDMHADEISSKRQPVYKAKNPYGASDIYFMNDAPHLIKCVRNAWANSYAHSKTRTLWNKGHISWKLVQDLYNQRQQMDGFYLTKLTYEHVHLTSFSKMKVRLAAQVVSQTIANALPQMEYAAREFVTIFNKYFDVLNVRSKWEAPNTRKESTMMPYSTPADPRLQWLTVDFIKYLDDWEDAVMAKPNFTVAQKKKMLIPEETVLGLRRSAYGFVAATEFLLQQEGVDFVLSERFGQDPLESLFGNMRQMRGGNEAPNVQQFCENINAARIKSSHMMRVIGGNTQQRPDLLTPDNTKIPRRKRQKKLPTTS